MTELEKTEVQRTPDEAYGVAEMRFVCASQIVIRSTGEVVKITPIMKNAYLYMMNQYIGFSSRRQKFYTDQRQIAAALDISRDTLSKVLEALKKLGIVETAGWQGNSESYIVYFFSDVADNLQVIHKEWKGVPAWDHERANKNFKSRNQKPTNEENRGDDNQSQHQEHEQQPPGVASSSATDDPEQQSGVSQSAGDSGDDVSGTDAVNERYYASLEELQNWQHNGDPEGFIAYGAKWGKTRIGAIMDLINSHVKTLMSDRYKGYQSAANDNPSGADARYKQQQAQRAAAVKQAHG